MRAIRIAMIVAVLFGIAACGGGGGDPAQGAINDSAKAFDEIITHYILNCIDFPCNCPGGGTIDAVNGDLQLVNCSTSGGETFNGTVTFNTGDSITFNFTEFGDDCDNVSGTITGIQTEACSGTVSGTCADEFVTCSMSTDCETCNI